MCCPASGAAAGRFRSGSRFPPMKWCKSGAAGPAATGGVFPSMMSTPPASPMSSPFWLPAANSGRDKPPRASAVKMRAGGSAAATSPGASAIRLTTWFKSDRTAGIPLGRFPSPREAPTPRWPVRSVMAQPPTASRVPTTWPAHPCHSSTPPDSFSMTANGPSRPSICSTPAPCIWIDRFLRPSATRWRRPPPPSFSIRTSPGRLLLLLLRHLVPAILPAMPPLRPGQHRHLHAAHLRLLAEHLRLEDREAGRRILPRIGTKARLVGQMS